MTTQTPTTETAVADPTPAPPADDLLWRQLKTVPAFRALLRAVEARFYYSIPLPEPIFDLGCGDGHFSQMVFSEPITAGVDPWWGPLQKARDSQMYTAVLQAMGSDLPFPDSAFASAFSNSVLEHIPDVQPVLNETNRVLQMNGRFLITMPSHYFTEYLGGATFFEQLGLSGLADTYRRFFNRISRHVHTDPPQVWAERLAQAGFGIERWQYYFSRSALRALEWGHVQGLPAAVMHYLTGHWIVAPWKSSLQRTEQWLRPFYEEPFGPEGAYILMVARKQANGPISAHLPPARPFSLAELEAAVQEPAPAPTEEIVVEPTAVDATPVEQIEAEETTSQHPATLPQTLSIEKSDTDTKPGLPRNIVSLSLVILSLLLAVIGQMNLQGDTASLAAAWRWFGLSAVPLLLLAWRQRSAGRGKRQWRLPAWPAIPARRWGVGLALLLSLLAQWMANGAQRPLPALLLWFVAAGVGFYALQNPPSADDEPVAWHISRRSALITAVLFILALLLRTIDLSGNPFMLNGIEASLGRNAVQILRGQLNSPFATGWITNPTLPLFGTAVFVRLLGQTVLALRLLPALVGAVTIAVTYLVGQKVWGERVGLIAAILLLGSHFHLHYSRLGMTNIWDPLLVLLTLGLLAAAWQTTSTGNQSKQRLQWLLAGVAVGLNAYGFTSARLLPIMLLILFLLLFWSARTRLRQQAGNIAAMLLLALVVALPQMLFYTNHPEIFWERANALGIFAGQSGWLAAEATRIGQSETAVLWQQIQQSLLAFNGIPDKSPAYRPLVPLLSFGPAVLLIFGTIWSLLRLRKLRYSLLVVWLLVTMVVAGALVVDGPQSHRLVIAAPALAFLAAIALDKLGALALRAIQAERETVEATAVSVLDKRKRAQRLLWGLILLASLFALNDVAFYFGQFPQENQFGDTNTEVAYRVAQTLNELDGDWTAYFYGPPIMFIDFPTFPYLLTDFTAGQNFFNVASDEEQLAAAPTEQMIFIFLPQRVEELAAVAAQYPNGIQNSQSGQYGNPLFYTYTVSPSS